MCDSTHCVCASNAVLRLAHKPIANMRNVSMAAEGQMNFGIFCRVKWLNSSRIQFNQTTAHNFTVHNNNNNTSNVPHANAMSEKELKRWNQQKLKIKMKNSSHRHSSIIIATQDTHVAICQNFCADAAHRTPHNPCCRRKWIHAFMCDVAHQHPWNELISRRIGTFDADKWWNSKFSLKISLNFSFDWWQEC